MSTQYDHIAAAYDALTQMPPEHIEHYTIHKILRPRVKDAKVLELACGLGFHARQSVDMGASHVPALDISQGMIEAARAAASTNPDHKAKLSFQVANCQQPQQYPDGPFDVVLACWLLNYAPNYDVLVSTFRNAACNLRKGGVFTGSTVVPAEDPLAWLERQHTLRPKRRGIIWNDLIEEVEGGMKVKTTALLKENEKDNKVHFLNFHLQESLYQRAAREGGFENGIEWQTLEFPHDFVGRSDEEWLRSFVTLPETGVFVAKKS